MFRILIIEDYEPQRKELKTLLENALYQADAAEDFAHIPELVKSSSPDLVLMDIELPDMDGITLCRRIREYSQVPIIFVTGRNNSMDELNGILTGGDDYIYKPYQAPVLLARIAAVLKRSRGMGDSAVIRKGGMELNLLNSSFCCENKRIDLTRTELRIFHMLLLNSGRIVSREALLDDLWNNHIYIDDNTLSVNITRIRNKLEEVGVKTLIQTKRGQGYLISV